MRNKQAETDTEQIGNEISETTTTFNCKMFSIDATVWFCFLKKNNKNSKYVVETRINRNFEYLYFVEIIQLSVLFEWISNEISN